MRKYYLLCILLLSFVSCDNSSTGNGVSNTTNSGDDTSDFVDNETWSSTINIVWNGTDVTVTGSADGVSVTNANGYVTVTSTAKNIEYAVSGNAGGGFGGGRPGGH